MHIAQLCSFNKLNTESNLGKAKLNLWFIVTACPHGFSDFSKNIRFQINHRYGSLASPPRVR